MNEFVNNLHTLSTTLDKYQNSRDPSLRDKISFIIKINDELVECIKVNQDLLSEYIYLRRRYDSLSLLEVEQHKLALRRKQKLLDIQEDTNYLKSLNEYIKLLVEEKKDPIDNLLSNLEYNEAKMVESNSHLEASKKKYCVRLKKVCKWILLVIMIIIVIKIWKIIRN